MKCGLALSGGAAWGLANIGILQILEREKCFFDCIAGSSMGAIVAGAYALGISLDDIEATAKKLSMLRVTSFVKPPFTQGFHGGLLQHQLEDILLPLIGDATLADAKIPFLCVAGKVSKPVSWERIFKPKFTEYFFECIEPYVFPPDTRMIDALLATSAIPVVFAPVTVGRDTFVDLVHFGALPARKLRALHQPDIVIGTDTNPRFGRLRRVLPAPWREFMDRGHHEIEEDRGACDLVLQPTMPAAMFRFDRASDFIRSGRTAAEKRLPALRRIFHGRTEKSGPLVS